MKISEPKPRQLPTVFFLTFLLLSSCTLLADVFSEVPTVQICNSGTKNFSVASISNDKYWKYGEPKKFELRGWYVVEPGFLSSCIYAAGHGSGGNSYYVFAIEGGSGKRVLRVSAGDNWRGFTDSAQRFCINPNVDRLADRSNDERYNGSRSQFGDQAVCSDLGPGWVLGPPSVALGTSGSNSYKLTLDPDEWPVVELAGQTKLTTVTPESPQPKFLLARNRLNELLSGVVDNYVFYPEDGAVRISESGYMTITRIQMSGGREVRRHIEGAFLNDIDPVRTIINRSAGAELARANGDINFWAIFPECLEAGEECFMQMETWNSGKERSKPKSTGLIHALTFASEEDAEDGLRAIRTLIQHYAK